MNRTMLGALALLAISAVPVAAVTVIDRTGPGQADTGYDLGEVPVGETREIAPLDPTFAGVTQVSLGI